MKDFRFTLISFFIFIIIVGLGVLAFFALQRGNESGADQQIRALEVQLKEKDMALQQALRRLAELETDNQTLVQTNQVNENLIEGNENSSSGTNVTATTNGESTSTINSTSTTTNTDASLLASLKSLQTRKAILEPGDKGADVGTIQKFLNSYEGKTGGVDNDFGPGTRKRVEAFQKAEGLSVDGGVGLGTLSAMITWLESQG